jgi:hypothetical protein
MSPHVATALLRSYQGALWTVDVETVRRRSTFLLDLGAGLTSIDASLSAELAPGPRRRATGVRMTREQLPLVARNPAVIDLGALLPSDWPRVDGALGLDAFERVPFVADFRTGALRIGDLGDLRGMASVPIRLFRQMGGVSLVALARVDGGSRDLWFEVDNSNVGPVVVSPGAAEALGLPPEAQTAEISVAGLSPFLTPVAVADCLYDGSLGITFTGGRTLAFDLERRRLWLGPTGA